MTTADCINTQSILGRNATPIPVIESARKVLGSIDLDPASDEVINRDVQASQIFTYEDDGFAQEWNARNVWLNPPGRTWSKTLGKEVTAIQWIRKLYKEYCDLRVENAIVLVYRAGSIGSVDLDILHDCISCITCRGAKSSVVNGSGRISFELINDKNERVRQTSNTQSSVFLLFSEDIEINYRFEEEFSQYGKIFWN